MPKPDDCADEPLLKVLGGSGVASGVLPKLPGTEEEGPGVDGTICHAAYTSNRPPCILAASSDPV